MRHKLLCGAAGVCVMILLGSTSVQAATEKLTPAENAGDTKEVTLTVTLAWEDDDNADGMRPEEGIEVVVTRKIADVADKAGNKAESIEIEELSAGNEYCAEEKVAVFSDEGEAYEYSVSVEDESAEGYTLEMSPTLEANDNMTFALTAVPVDESAVAAENREFAALLSGLSAVQALALGLVCGAAVILAIAGILHLCGKKEEITDVGTAAEGNHKEETVWKEETARVENPSMPDSDGRAIGIVHNIGNRRNQQDTFGTASTRLGFLAVVSDGMGGLSNGEKVSQQAVKGMIQAADQVRASGSNNPLYEMLSLCNSQVLNLLGPDQIYKSGATLLAVLTNGSRFRWIAVGDSRIYLYCDSHLIQINREHIYKQKLLHMAVNKKATFDRVKSDPQRERLVSFLGMGDLEYIDGSLRPVDVRRGDKLLLMSDGVFNTISERTIIKILESTANADEAARLMEQQVLAAQNPKQDNFTCLILDF